MQAKPNLLIVGAPKCGTTTLHALLHQHPEIFCCTPKEPKFLSFSAGKVSFNGPADHYVFKQIVKTQEEYYNLFSSGRDCLYRCDASADNLYYYDSVIPIIKEKLGDPRIIIMLRDPVARAYSAYDHLVRDFREKLSFRRALSIEESRKHRGYELIWHYRSCGQYSAAVQAYRSTFSSVHIIILEDLATDFKSQMGHLCGFLDVSPHAFMPKKENPSPWIRSKALHKILNLQQKHTHSEDATRYRSALRLINNLAPYLRKFNYRSRIVHKSGLSRRLAEDFSRDVDQLAAIIDRPLRELWLEKYLR